MRKYYPDLSSQVDDGHVIIEPGGEIKAIAAKCQGKEGHHGAYWVPGVNHWAPMAAGRSSNSGMVYLIQAEFAARVEEP